MTRLVLALLITTCATGCHKRSSTAPASPGGGAGTSGPAIVAKQLALSWGITARGEMSEIFLATTDETGKQVSHPIGTYKGACATIKPAAEMKALTGVACTTSGGGTELHAVRRVDEIVVVQLGTQPGVTPDPMAREEVTRVKIPTGTGIEVAP